MKTALWSYPSRFPHALSARVERETIAYVHLEGYGNQIFRKDYIIILPEDLTLKTRLESIKQRYKEAQGRLRLEWEYIAIREIPELEKLYYWKKWKEENV